MSQGRKIRCKFRVDSVEQNEDDQASVFMSAVTDGCDENEQFWKWTPAGNLSFQVVRPESVQHMERGREFYIDITPAG